MGTGPAQQGEPGGPWPTQFSGHVVCFFFTCRSIATSSIEATLSAHAQSIDTRTRTRDRVIASFPGAWERN